MKYIADIYEAVLTRIKTQLPQVKLVDIYNSQYEGQQEGSLPFNTPAVFVEVDTSDVRMIGGGLAGGTVTIVLHLVVPVVNTTSSLMDANKRSRSYGHLQLNDQLTALVSGIVVNVPNTVASTISLINSTFSQRVGLLEVCLTGFSTHVKTKAYASPQASVTPSIDLDI
jgi:hypothetical protein